MPLHSTEQAEAVQDSPTALETRGRVPELDGFRAIAIWMVLGAHLVDGWPLPSGALNGVPAPLLFVLSRGWLGVDLFFVLSGLLITGILLDSREKPSYFRNFYARRFLRIIPLYFTVITITFLAYRSPVLYFLLSYCFLANIAGALRVGVPHGPGVFWSLAVEEHFYLAWPMVIRFISRNSVMLTCLGIFLASPVLRGIAAAKGPNAGDLPPFMVPIRRLGARSARGDLAAQQILFPEEVSLARERDGDAFVSDRGGRGTIWSAGNKDCREYRASVHTHAIDIRRRYFEFARPFWKPFYGLASTVVHAR